MDMTRREAIKATAATIPLAAGQALAQRATKAKKYLILSCDGGGLRGILTAKIIERLHAEAPFIDQIDLFAGTSTGGILALGLAHGFSPTQIVKLYRDNATAIFDRDADKPNSEGAMERILSGLGDKKALFIAQLEIHPGDLLHPKYPSDGIAKVMKDTFGDVTLDSLKLKKSVMVTTLRLLGRDKGWAPLVLHNVGPDEAASDKVFTKVEDRPTPDTRAADAILCTTAAPLYFAPHKHPTFGYCVDGGLFANCPASFALALALRANQGSIENIRILSIGTGAQISGIDIPNSHHFDKPSEFGALAWLDPVHRGERIGGKQKLTPAFPLISALLDATSSTHNYICQQALTDIKYRRLQVKLPKPVALDDSDKDSLDFLESCVSLIPQAEWDAVKEWLKLQIG
jgi:predicted acylesterase/phospholipase RssA